MRQQLESGSDDLLELIRENNKLAKEALSIAKKTRRSLRVTQWVGVVKFLLVLIPLVAGFIFLPSLIGQLDKQFAATTGGAGIFDTLRSLPALLGSSSTSKAALPTLPKNIDPKLLEDFLKKQGVTK